MIGDNDLSDLAYRLGEFCVARTLKIAVAESCTGGWVAKAITDVPGSSTWFDRGIVSYSDEAKIQCLGVTDQTLAQSGAVSEATVAEMARGILENSPANISVAVSGIAGPAGGSADKPVGTVWFAWARRTDSEVQVRTLQRRLDGGRDDVRRQAVAIALNGCIDD